MPCRRRQTLLLDLDGTLVDPGPGIIGSCRYAMEQMGCPVGDDEDLRWIIGPSIRETFGRLLRGRDDLEVAIAHYRRRYAEWGISAATPYDGVFDVLARRKEAGARLFLCTAKASIFARQVVERLGFAPLLDGVYGAEFDGRFEDKGALIAHLVDQEGLAPDEVCMVGDREHDVLAARRNGIPTVGVLWGYGSREELAAAGAQAIIDRPAELLD
jgi:phosphoglycolate phosphatase